MALSWTHLRPYAGLFGHAVFASFNNPPPPSEMNSKILNIYMYMYNRHLKLSHLAWLKEFLSFFMFYFF